MALTTPSASAPPTPSAPELKLRGVVAAMGACTDMITIALEIALKATALPNPAASWNTTAIEEIPLRQKPRRKKDLARRH